MLYRLSSSTAVLAWFTNLASRPFGERPPARRRASIPGSCTTTTPAHRLGQRRAVRLPGRARERPLRRRRLAHGRGPHGLARWEARRRTWIRSAERVQGILGRHDPLHEHRDLERRRRQGPGQRARRPDLLGELEERWDTSGSSLPARRPPQWWRRRIQVRRATGPARRDRPNPQRIRRSRSALR